MCNEFKMLVELSDWRYIAQCEHKTVHLRWDHLTISLPPQAFLHLARKILQESAPDGALSSQHSATASSTTPKPTLRLRLNTVQLEFASADLLPLRTLLQQATGLLMQSTVPAKSRVTNPPVTLRPCPQPTHFTLTQYLN